MSNQHIPAANRNVGTSDNRTTNAEKIDYAGIETERLREEYSGLPMTLARLKQDNDAIASVPDDETGDAVALQLGGIIKRGRDLRAEVENTRIVEVEPNFRRYQAGNSFFNSMKEELQPEDKQLRRTRPGLIDIAQRKIDAHQDRKEARERARLAEIARKAEADRREAERIAREAEVAARKAEADRLEAEARVSRAKTEESRLAREAEATEARNAEAAATAMAKQTEVAAGQSMERHADARISTLATSADIVRTRGTSDEGSGVLLTKATDKVAELEDRGQLTDESKLILFEHFTDDQVGMAVRKFANATGHRTKMAGCLIEIRKKNVTR